MRAYEHETMVLESHQAAICALVQDLLPLYLEGEVSPGSREQITTHLAGCRHCAGFLAGAQSVQAPLRRDLAQYHQRRGAVPIPPAPGWHGLLVAPVTVLICIVGGLGTILAGHGMRYGGPAELLVGGVVSLSALAALLLLARALAPLSGGRLWQLGAGLGTGVTAGFVLLSGVGPAQVAAVLLAVVAIGMVAGAVLDRSRGAPGGR